MAAGHCDFLIIGGGINGLLVARELVHTGASITLLERGEFGEEASWAGGGIISPLYPWRYRQPVTALVRWAQDYYPNLHAQLLEETGIDAELVRCGLLMLDARDAEAARTWATANGVQMEALDTAEVYTREPNLGAGFRQGLWMPAVTNVRNPRLLKALVSRLQRQSGVALHTHCEVLGFATSGTRIEEVQVREAGKRAGFTAGTIVLCAGAWSSGLLKEMGSSVHVEPVKGQMLLFKLQEQLTRSILLTDGRYVIPRQDGHVLVGSTLEYSGFDKQTTSSGYDSLLESACRLLPALKRSTPIAHWAGLRPGTQDGTPYIGRIRNWDNLFVNTGQFRNGLVLAPASARLLVDLILGRTPIVDPEPYAPV